MYEVLFSSQAEKYFKKLKEKPLKKLFKEQVLEVSKNPYIGQMKKGDLAGFYSLDIKYKSNNYELAYKIYEEEGKKIVVILAGSRENFYEHLKRLI